MLMLGGALTAAHAGTVTAGLDDLVLGFRASGGTGSAVNLEVDLGNISQYFTATSPITVAQLTNADLTAAYGATWSSRIGTDLYWGVVGSTGRLAGGPNGQPSRTLWASTIQTTGGTSTPWARQGSSAQGSGSTVIEGVYTGGAGSLNGATATANSSSAAVITASQAGSWSSQEGSLTAFSYFNPLTAFDSPGTTGFNNFKTDLYELRPNAAGGDGTLLGTFSLSTAGVLTFTPSIQTVAPAITTQPQSQAIAAGSSVTFTAAASGTPTPTYQWSKDSNPIIGATNTTYTIASVQTTDQGSYTVKATNSAGNATSNAAVLTVNVAPAITTQPQSQAITLGNSVTFTGAASGTPAPTYQWNKDSNPISGATNASFTIANVQTTDQGSYTLTATNSVTSATSNAATLTVNVGPAITTQPTASTVLVGQPASFTVAATGSPAPTYQWNKNSNPISGATNATYSIASAQSTDQGSYTVTVTNVVTFVTSNPVTLTVNPLNAPTISAQPQSQTGTIGQPVTFSVTAAGTPAPTYQWSKDNNPITGATNATYTIAVAQATDAGSYTVAVHNSAGTIVSNAAVLNFPTLPSFTTQPVSQAVTAGLSATFTSAATGVPAPTYQWNKNGVPVTGATNASYVITSVQPADAANYTVTATNSVGSTGSNVAALTVNTSPTITTQPAAQAVTAGSSATFVVVATGTPAPTYVWKKDGNPVSGATNSTLILSSVQASDTGNYTVTVTNTLGSVVSNAAALTVYSPPAIVTQPQPVTVPVGTGATFTVVASGFPAPTYQWTRNGSPISGATNTSFTIASPQLSDAANYAVTVTNFLSSVASNSVALTVTSAPQIATQPASVAVNLGSTASFTVTVTAVPAATYQWLKNGAAITGATNSTYTIASAQLSDAGNYTVNATNSLGTASSNVATLSINLAPAITTQPTDVTVVAGASATLSVVATGAPAPAFQWNLNGQPISGATSASYTIPAAAAADAGSYTVTISNTLGSLTSNAATVTVVSPPTITFQPVGGTVTVKTAYTLSVVASGSGITYQWAKDGVNISGATGPVYNIGFAQATDAGSYTVTVTNAAGTVTSNAAAIAVVAEGAPVITAQPLNQVAAVGGSAAFGVDATGAPPPTYQWNKGGTAISGATNAVYVLNPVQDADYGVYTVTLTNSVGTTTSNPAVLSPPAAPSIATQPLSQTTATGGTVTFTVVANGMPAPAYQWNKNGAVITGATSTFYTITGAQASDAGTYTVTITNTAGTITSNGATLGVISAPAITTQPAAQTALVGSPATFTVVATGTPAPVYLWNKNGVAIPGATNSIYTIPAVAASDAGNYSVTVSNSVGSVTSNTVALTTSLQSYAGTYFGSFGNGVGNWVLYVRADNTAVYVAYLTQRLSAIVLNLQINPDGSFSTPGAEVRTSDAPVSVAIAGSDSSSGRSKPQPDLSTNVVTVSGKISGSSLNGTVSGLGLTLSGSADAGTGPAQSVAGFYSTPAVNSSSGTTYTVIGASGQAMIVSVTPTSVDGGAGTVSASGQVTVTSGSGAQITAQVNPATKVISATLVPAGNGSVPVYFAGAADGGTATSRLVNISTRGYVPAGGSLTPGFVLRGAGSKQLVIRGVGSSLAQFPGIANPLLDPKLDLVYVQNNTQVKVSNDDWGGAASMTAAFAAVGAFPLLPNSKDAALVTSVPYVNGGYTARVSATSPTAAGIVLAEVYDADVATAPVRIINISTLAFAGSGEQLLTAGFVIDGTAPKQLLIRGIGPGLAQFIGAASVMADPQIQVIPSSQQFYVAASNDNWGGTAALKAAFTQAGAFALDDNSRDAALVVTLTPGAYTVTVSGVGGTAGQALLEIYDLDKQ